METVQKMLYQKAARELPDFPKNSDDLHVAILPYNTVIQTCRWEDFLWLKARGKNTIGQLQDAHIRRTGTKVLLVHGEERLSNDTQLRRIRNNYNDLVVFWTVVDTQAALSQDVQPQIWELAKKMDVYWESGVFPGLSNTVAGDQAHSSVSAYKPIIASQDASTGNQDQETTFTRVVVDDVMKRLRAERPKAKLVLKASQSQTIYFIECFDCINVAYKIASVKQARKVHVRMLAHLKDPAHIRSERARTGETGLQMPLTSAIRSQMIDSPPGTPADQRQKADPVKPRPELPQHMRAEYVSVGSISNRVCRVTCQVCRSWSYEVEISYSKVAFAVAQSHTESMDHKTRCAKTKQNLNSILVFLHKKYPKANVWIKDPSEIEDIDLNCKDCGALVYKLNNDHDRDHANSAVWGHLRVCHPRKVEQSGSTATSSPAASRTTEVAQKELRPFCSKLASETPFSLERGDFTGDGSQVTKKHLEKLVEAKQPTPTFTQASVLNSHPIEPESRLITVDTIRKALAPIAHANNSKVCTASEFRTDLAILREKYPLDNFATQINRVYSGSYNTMIAVVPGIVDPLEDEGEVADVYMRCHDCSRDLTAEKGKWIQELERHLSSGSHRLSTVNKIKAARTPAAQRKAENERRRAKENHEILLARRETLERNTARRRATGIPMVSDVLPTNPKRKAPETQSRRILRTRFR